MECERLIKLIKNWYLQVQDEAMAPARMVDFMRTHLADCPVCRIDPGVDGEIKKIIEIVLPAAKIPKAVRKDDVESDDDFEGLDEITDDTETDDDEDDNGDDEETIEGDEEIDDLEDDDI
jgi:hypothetical protein